MTSKFTSRFRRRNETEATAAPSSDEAQKPAAEASASAPTPETSEGPAEPAKSEAATSEAAPAAAAKAEAEAVSKPTVPPSRLIEVEKPKSTRPELAKAKAWMDGAHTYRVPAAAAVAIMLALGTGYGIGAAGKPADATQAAAAARLIEVAAKDLRDANGQIGQLAAELKSVRGAVDGIKGEREKAGSDILAKQKQLTDRVERSGQENATRIGRLAEQLDRIEKTQRDATRQGAAPEKSDKAEKAADRTEKSEKPEKVVAVPVPPAKPADVAHTGSIGEAKPVEKIDPRKTPLDGYVVRDYDDGYALIETRSGRFLDVAVGYTLPGVGKVEAIERRGRQWVVVTPKGFIGER